MALHSLSNLLPVFLLVSSVLFTRSALALDWVATPFSPPAVPIAVRSPYLSTWLPQGKGTALNGAWATFWNAKITAWTGFIRVDNTSYSFLGDAVVANHTFNSANQTSVNITTTQSIFVMSAGSVDVTVTFLSPIEPDDLVKQSMPFSYMSLSVASTDGQSHSIQLYTDISGEWVSGNNSDVVVWNTTSSDILYHGIGLENQTLYGEINDQAQCKSSLQADNLTYQTGEDIVVRGQFLDYGKLANTKDTNYRSISSDWPVFAFSWDLGSVDNIAASPIVTAVGLVRDPAILYIVENNATQSRSLYFWSNYSSAADALTTFLGDYSGALSRANMLDAQVKADASAISDTYADIVALSLRQAMGATEITISGSSGSWNTSDIKMFVKGVAPALYDVNTADVIYSMWPTLMYLNPDYGKYILEPLLAYQATGQYPHNYSVHDLGTYPMAVGHNNGQDTNMPVEECGNMLITTLSHYQITGDSSLITAYHSLLTQWTEYLIKNALYPALQLSSDSFSGALANQTNLAVKGIIGIKAMAEISTALSNTTAVSSDQSTAANYLPQWESLAYSDACNHLTLNYGNSSSWGLTYNLYADKLLGLDLFPQSVYDLQTSWYTNKNETYGVPLDTRYTWTKSDWSIWTAAFVTDTSVRDALIEGVKNYASSGLSSVPFSDYYDASSGDTYSFKARPVVGGHLAFVSLWFM
ncbi:DUF1793-domain-containing protein [Fistulina hepatica ATCC 64428]|uniref:DUF1793-domain-containing protein n=1 Tax=Fistulina hepatica ATCC 64428 TaxID=1128425 RepID=A0A0D7A8S8_9AGAR|nr:DUF1793-domain-containing protein [Fistulina hepatica ATCC 64428]